MDILGTIVEVVLGNINNIEAEARVFDLDLAPSGIKEENSSLKKGEIKICAEEDKPALLYARTSEPGMRPDAQGVRASACNALLSADKQGYRSLLFSPLGVASGFSLIISAKIMAQEIFRYLKTGKNTSLEYIRCVLSGPDLFSAFEKNFSKYLDHMVNTLARGPYLTVDGIVEKDQGLVLIERKNPPFGWALPGGFVDYGETVETAVEREVKEETGLDLKGTAQFRVYSAPGRDPRFHTVSVVFSGKGEGIMQAADDAVNAQIFPFDSLPEPIAFDHRQIIEDYQKYKCKI